MNITEFAESRGIQAQTISRYINRHEKDFKNHTQKKGKSIELDEKAIDLLNQKYPLPKPIEIIENPKTQEELIKTQQLVIELQNKLMNMTEKVAIAETQQVMLDIKDSQIAELTEKVGNLESELGAYRKSIFGFYRKI